MIGLVGTDNSNHLLSDISVTRRGAGTRENPLHNLLIVIRDEERCHWHLDSSSEVIRDAEL